MDTDETTRDKSLKITSDDLELSKRARKLHEEMIQRIGKLKSRGVKNPLKKLPGYGSLWFYRKRKDPSSEHTSADAPAIEPSQVSNFVSKLKMQSEVREETWDEAVHGPGFEFPTEKETAKCNKHWSKKFKHWHPENKSVSNPSSRPFAIRFKAPLPTNEVEVDGHRYRVAENNEEIEEHIKNGTALKKQQPMISDPKFYADIIAEYGSSTHLRILSSKDDPEVSLADPNSRVTTVHAPFPLASHVLTEMRKRLIADGKVELASSLNLEQRKADIQDEDDDDDEVQYPSSTSRVAIQLTKQDVPLADGDEASACN